MDINLGKVTLTQNQIQRLHEIKIDNIKGLCYWPGKQDLIAVTEKELSVAEKSQIIIAVQALSDTPIVQPESEMEKLKNRIGNLEQKVTTLESKTAAI